MERFKGASAVSNARTAILAFTWLLLIAGIIVTIVGFAIDYFVEWEIVICGVTCIIMAIGGFISNSVLKGFEKVTMACELYIEQLDKKESEEAESKTIRLPMDTEPKIPTHI